MFKNFFPAREPFNAYSHLVGAIGSVIFLVYLIVNSSDDPGWNRIAFIAYGITVFLMFVISVYRLFGVFSSFVRRFFQKVDLS